MVYICNVLFSVIYIYFLRGIQKIKYIYFLPIIILWTMIIGGQYNVGTDYFLYRNMYINPTDFFKQTGEYIFYYTIIILRHFFSNPQVLFILVGGIESLLYVKICKQLVEQKMIEINKLSFFTFLFLTYGTLFYNQMNLIRQAFVIYLFTIALLYMLNKELSKYILMFIIGMFIHRSVISFIPIYFLYNFILKKVNKKLFFEILILLGSISLFLPIDKIVRLPIAILAPRYSFYLDSVFMELTPWSRLLTKLIYIPFYLEAVKLLDEDLPESQKSILKIGLVSFALRLACLKFQILARVGEYFVLISILPIFYLINYYIEKGKKYRLAILLIFILLIFILKVTFFAWGEYDYHCILFQK